MSLWVCFTVWCEREGLDYRSMRFARDVQRQIERMMTSGDAGGANRRRFEGQNDHSHKNMSRKRRRDGYEAFNVKKTERDEHRSLRKALTLGFANRYLITVKSNIQ